MRLEQIINNLTNEKKDLLDQILELKSIHSKEVVGLKDEIRTLEETIGTERRGMFFPLHNLIFRYIYFLFFY